MFAAVFASILVLDELITFGLSAVAGRGGGVGAWMLLIACVAACRPRLGARALAISTLACCLLVMSVESLSLSTLYLITLTLATLVICSARLDLPLAQSRAFLIGLMVVLVAQGASALGFDLFERLSGTQANRPTGLYSEPSHLAYYVGALYLLAVLSRPADRGRAGLLALASLVGAFSASALLPIGIVLADWSRNAKHRKMVLLAACVGGGALIGLQWEYLLARLLVSDEGSTSLTLQVLLYYYHLFATHLVTAPLDTFGPDGFRQAYETYSSQLGYMPEDLNSTDGSFLAVKVMVEMGVGFLFLFLVVIFARVRQAGGIAVGLLLAQYIFLRGFGLTSSIVVALVLVASFQAIRLAAVKVPRSAPHTSPAAAKTRASRRLRSDRTKPELANRALRTPALR